MKKLENIPKKNIYKVPEGYFDQLPMVLQARIEALQPKAQPKPWLQYSFRYALPMVILAAATIFLFKPRQSEVEKLLASVSTTELVAYLQETTLTTEDLLEDYEFDEASAEAIEQEVYFGFNLRLDDLNVLDDWEF